MGGHRFDSKKEARRYVELKSLEAAGVIWRLRLQEPFVVEINGVIVCRYVADFVYDAADGYVVEDSKGVRTPVYRLKKKLMRAVLGIDIKEV